MRVEEEELAEGGEWREVKEAINVDWREIMGVVNDHHARLLTRAVSQGFEKKVP